MMRDDDGQEIHAGDVVSFCYGIPPVGVQAKVADINGVLFAMTPGHKPDKCKLSELRRHVGGFYKIRRHKTMPNETVTPAGLKPCPFCGGEARIETVNHDYGVTYSVGCFGSGRCGASFTLFDHRNDAIATWNRRDIVAAPMEGEWRTISASDVDWCVGVDRYGRKPRALYQLCSVDHSGEWADLTLGHIADMGEYNWIRAPGVGKLAVTIIKSVIDMAAEGKRVKRGPFPEPYIPTCERGEP